MSNFALINFRIHNKFHISALKRPEILEISNFNLLALELIAASMSERNCQHDKLLLLTLKCWAQETWPRQMYINKVKGKEEINGLAQKAG